MTRVCVVCEGQTEETFVRELLAPTLGSIQVYVFPQLIETSPGHKGGALSYERVCRHLRNTLRQPSAPVVTTLFDLYALDTGFPGFTNAQGQPLGQRLETLTGALHQNIIHLAGCPPEQFIPYIQPYEFEALLFSDVPTLTGLEEGWARATQNLQSIRGLVDTPEEINDGPTTSPAAHLIRHLTDPRYRKTLHGPIAASRIGLSKIESECSFFAAWLERLRKLAPR